MTSCRHCNTELDDTALLCPVCEALVHADELAKYYSSARKALAAGALSDAAEQFRACLALLPPDTRQAQQIGAELARIDARLHQAKQAASAKARRARSMQFAEARGITKARIAEMQARARAVLKVQSTPQPLRIVVGGVTDAVIWLVTVVWMILTLIVRGLLNASTWRSLAAWIILLGLMMGWREAALFGTYVFLHETGHLVPVQYYGIGFRWPFFVPFVGAFVIPERLADRPSQNVAISLGGPIGGILPAAAVLLLCGITGCSLPKTVTEISTLSLVIGLANLSPFWILDGARIASLLSRPMLAVTVFVIAMSSWYFSSILGGLLAGAYLVRVFMPSDDIGSPPSLQERCFLWGNVLALGGTVAIALPFVP